MHPIYGFGPTHPLIYLFFLLFDVILAIIVLIPCWHIFKKAGFSPWLSLLMLLPIINIIMLYFLAFSHWNVVPAELVYPAPPPVPSQPQA